MFRHLRQRAVQADELGLPEQIVEPRAAFDAQASLYPPEYGQPTRIPELAGESIVASHTLIPEALRRAMPAPAAIDRLAV